MTRLAGEDLSTAPRLMDAAVAVERPVLDWDGVSRIVAAIHQRARVARRDVGVAFR